MSTEQTNNNTTFEKLSFTRKLDNGDQLQFSAIAQGEGPIVLCLHGFPDHALSYRHQLPAFAKAGYRAIAITLRGYEPSSIPSHEDFSLIRIAEDIIDIIKQLKQQSPSVEKVHLVGHDWGAAISYLVAAMAPELLFSSTAMAVPHVRRFTQKAFKKYPIQLKYSWYMFFFQIRGLSDFIVERNNFSFIRWLWQSWCPTWSIPEKDLDRVIETLAQPGVKKSALAYYRSMFNLRSQGTKETAIIANKTIHVPTLAITGADDGCIQTDVFQNLMLAKDFSKELRVEKVIGAGHFLHQEKPEQLNALMLEWFAKHAN
jgi:pimeloyl-ACP methyl ester carboxylesterase